MFCQFRSLILSLLCCALGLSALTPIAAIAQDMIEVRAVTEMGEESVPPLIVEVDFNGVAGTGAHRDSRYFSFSAEFERGLMDVDGKMGFPALNLVVVPLTRELAHQKAGENGESSFSREMLKTQFRREANLGLQGSVSIYPLGWAWEGESKLSNGNQVERFKKFYNLAVDLIGVGYLATANGGKLPNVQAGKVEFQGGLGFDLTESMDLKIMIGGEAHGGLGAYRNSGRTQAGFGSLSSVYAEWDAGLQTLMGHYTAFVITEYQRFDVLGRFDNPGIGEVLLRAGFKGSW
jgi:hypothetical protein